MGWLICIGLLVSGIIFNRDLLIVAAGLFAISGSISIWLHNIYKK